MEIGSCAGVVAGSGSVAGAASGGPFLVGRPGHWWAARESAHTLGVETPPLRWIDPPEGPAIALLDQTRLPAAEAIVTCGDVPALEDAIRRLVVRGAPLLGVAGAFGVALAAARGDDVAAAAEAIGKVRPTAVNLAWGANRALAAYQASWAASQQNPHHTPRLAAQAALGQD